MRREALLLSIAAVLTLASAESLAQSCAALQQEHDMRVRRLIETTGFGFDAANAQRIEELRAIIPNCSDYPAPNYNPAPQYTQPHPPPVYVPPPPPTYVPPARPIERVPERSFLHETFEKAFNGLSNLGDSWASATGMKEMVGRLQVNVSMSRATLAPPPTLSPLPRPAEEFDPFHRSPATTMVTSTPSARTTGKACGPNMREMVRGSLKYCELWMAAPPSR